MKSKKASSSRVKSPGARDSSWPPGWTEELEREFQQASECGCVYDKAKWHYDGDFPKTLPEEQAYVHTGFFVGWLIGRNMVSQSFVRDFPDLVPRFKRKAITGPEVYQSCGGVLAGDMLTPMGNQFTQHYLDGQYVKDYRRLLARRLPSLYHVQDTQANYEILKPQIDARFEEWRKGKSKRKRTERKV